MRNRLYVTFRARQPGKAEETRQVGSAVRQASAPEHQSSATVHIGATFYDGRANPYMTARAFEPGSLKLPHTLLTAFARSVQSQVWLVRIIDARALSATRLILTGIVIAVATMHDLAVRDSPNCQLLHRLQNVNHTFSAHHCTRIAYFLNPPAHAHMF